ncbi:MAG: SDR family NAD(P)-dependent oxidoreductase [Parvularculaceae bacterium]|nr:SDR family NAD(P)-dependent oxidoreductase [Parvularculaceae bacterium]
MGELRFDGRVAVVTGGGRGLGRAYARLLGARGAKVVVNDPGTGIAGDGVDKGPAESVVAEIRAAGGDAVASLDSVATKQGGEAIVAQALDAYGRVDIVICNAGNVRYGSLLDIPYDDFRAVLDVHLLGTYHVVRPAFPHLCRQKYGRIVLTSSIGGIYGTKNIVNYGVSKAGILGLNNVAAIEGAEFNVKSNAILPGAVTRMADGLDTSQYPPMEPELVAPVVGWLSHEKCSISGEMLVSMAGRVSRVYVGETEGVFRPDWTIENVAEAIGAVRAMDRPWVFPAGEGYMQHLQQSFAFAVEGAKKVR